MVNCSLAHVLFECSGLIEKRILETEILRNECPINMFTDFQRLNNQDKTIYIMSGFGGKYIKEFENVYNVFLKFVISIIVHKQNTP